MGKGLSKEKIIGEYNSVKEKLGKQPSSTLFYIHSNVSKRALVRYFGRNAYTKLVKEAGDTPKSFSSPKSDLGQILINYGKLVRKLNSKPIEEEWNMEGYSPTVSGIRVSHSLKWSDVTKKFIEKYSTDTEWSDVMDILLPQKDSSNEEPQAKKTPQSCFVYLMLDKRTMLHKIGISNSAGYREKTLQSEKPSIKMVSKKEYPNRRIAANIEKALHTSYEHKRKRGEWFLLDDGDVEELKLTLDD